jgi:hypothetical protein
MDDKKPFFIHIPKNMGNFIYKHYYGLEQNSKTVLYGMYDSIDEYYQENHLAVPIVEEPYYHTRISIDHLTPWELDHLNILQQLPNFDIKNTTWFMIIRDPLERFISLCNYWNVPPNQLIYNITKIEELKHSKYNLYQHLRPQHDYLEDTQKLIGYREEESQKIKIFSMKDKEGICEFLRSYSENTDIHYNEPVYASRKFYRRDMLTRENIAFIKKYYRKDFLLYETL